MISKLLSLQGYKILNFGIIDIESHPAATGFYFEDYEIKILEQETLWGRIKRDIIWNLFVWLPGFNKYVVSDDTLSANKQNFSLFFSELKKESKIPRLVIGHLVMPHRPFHFDRNGNQRTLSENDFKDAVHDSLYIDQLVYTNTWIDSLAQAANRKHSRPLILIIAGDHGNRYSTLGLASREKQFMNLNAYFFSDKNYSTLYNNISPVNSFRIVLNKYFKSGLPLLKDSTIRFKD